MTQLHRDLVCASEYIARLACSSKSRESDRLGQEERANGHAEEDYSSEFDDFFNEKVVHDASDDAEFTRWENESDEEDA